MRFNLDDLNPPAWFDHPEDELAKICLRLASAKDLDKIRKKTVKKRIEFKRGQRFEVEDVDFERQSELTWKFCIVDWKGLFDNNNEPIECNDTNKILLMQNSPVFSKWVADCLETLNEDNAHRQESAEKN